MINNFGERVKRAWHNIYDLEKKPKQTQLTNWERQQDGKK